MVALSSCHLCKLAPRFGRHCATESTGSVESRVSMLVSLAFAMGECPEVQKD